MIELKFDPENQILTYHWTIVRSSCSSHWLWWPTGWASFGLVLRWIPLTFVHCEIFGQRCQWAIQITCKYFSRCIWLWLCSGTSATLTCWRNRTENISRGIGYTSVCCCCAQSRCWFQNITQCVETFMVWELFFFWFLVLCLSVFWGM